MTDARRLTVVQVLPALDSGGVERGTLEIGRALVEAGHRSIVVSNGGRLVAQLEREGSEHVRMPVHRKSLRSFLQVRPFRRLLAELQPDIVHARSRIPAWIAFLAWRKMDPATRPRFVTTVHGMYSVSRYSEIMTKGEAVIVISESVRDYVLKNYPACPPERLRLIYRGVDPQEFPWGLQPDADWLARWRAQHPQLAGKKVLALPGRLSRVKGHETFLRLMQALCRERDDLHALIIGGEEPNKPGYPGELQRRVQELGLTGVVTFTGHRDDLNLVLTQCDLVFALRVTPEAFGRTTLEPLRLGRPLIGWDVGGSGEVIRRIFPFGAVPAGDEALLLQRVRAWLATPQYPAESRDFLLSDMCDRTLACYRELAAGRRLPSGRLQ
ncbi:MAG: glycosyltransferase family 4 protein [Pseudomonadota bacterium]